MTSSPSTVEASCRIVASEFELEEHFRVRREIFVDAQGLFENDRDQYDRAESTLHVVAARAGAIIGAVRLYPLDGDGRWKGDRLAVRPGARARHAGPELVATAVRLAGARGGREMIAIVQRPVVRFFERCGWVTNGPVFHFRGVAHQPMRTDLHPPAIGGAR